MSEAVQSTARDFGLSPELASKAIDGHYYNIADANAWPVAGLLVLLDGQGLPVRGELHLQENLPSHLQEGAVRQARQLLQMHYAADAVVPLRILQTSQMRDAVDVRLDSSAAAAGTKRRRPARLLALGGAGALLALLLIAAFWLGGSQGVEPAGSPLGATPFDWAISGGRLAGILPFERGELIGEAPDIAEEELPVSVNARGDLAVGMRVALAPGLRLTLRSEPGGELGVPVGYMMDDDTAVIVGGPHEVAGTSDTIVWWRVRLDDGTEAWAAANTSFQTLLTPVE